MTLFKFAIKARLQNFELKSMFEEKKKFSVNLHGGDLERKQKYYVAFVAYEERGLTIFEEIKLMKFLIL